MNRAVRIPSRRMTLLHMGAALVTVLWLAWLAVLMTPLAPPAGTLRLHAQAHADAGPARIDQAHPSPRPHGIGTEVQP